MIFLCVIFIIINTQGVDNVNILVGDRESLYKFDSERNTSSPLILSESPQSVAYDFTRGYIYYVDNNSQLRRLSSRSKEKTITVDLGRADINEVIVDWLHNQLYIVKNNRKVLLKANSRGTTYGDILDERSLASFEGTISRDNEITMKHVEVDPYDKLLFICIMEVFDSHYYYAIASTNLNGGNMKAAISRTFRYYIAFTIDVNVKKLYVVGKRRLFVYNYQGEREDVMVFQTAQFHALNVFGNHLYGIMIQFPNDIFQVDLSNSSTKVLHTQKLNSENVLYDKILCFRVFDPRSQRRVRDYVHLCDRQDCSHGCEVRPHFGDSCTCQPGKVIAIDGRTCQECGQSGLHTYVVQPQIVGGSYSKPGNFPWHTIIYHKEMDAWVPKCGGTLVSSRMVLTAAHCVTLKCATCRPPPIPTHDIMVGLGKINRGFLIEEEGQVKRQIRKVHVHELFLGTSVSYAHDIAVLEMYTDVSFNTHVMPACIDFNLNYQQQLTEDKTLEGYIPGWGNTQECGYQINVCNQASETLKYATTNIISYQECFNISQSLGQTHYLTLTNDKFCAGNGSYSVIQLGDSGGGLTFVFNGLHFVYGVVSVKLSKLTTKNNLAYSFGAFTDVAVHLDWLKSLIN